AQQFTERLTREPPVVREVVLEAVEQHDHGHALQRFAFEASEALRPVAVGATEPRRRLTHRIVGLTTVPVEAFEDALAHGSQDLVRRERTRQPYGHPAIVA